MIIIFGIINIIIIIMIYLQRDGDTPYQREGAEASVEKQYAHTNVIETLEVTWTTGNLHLMVLWLGG